MKSPIEDYKTDARRGRMPYASVLFLTCMVACSATCRGAGNIFDDEWIPPKPVGQPHAAPAQPPPAAPATQPARLPIPAKADQAHSRALLKELYAKQITDRSLAGRKKLARTLLDEAPKLPDSPTDRFVLLIGAVDAAREAGNLDLCYQAADVIAEQYDVDGLSLKTDAVLKFNLRGDSPATQADNVKAALELIDPLLAADDAQIAAKVLALARPLAAHDRVLASEVQDFARSVEAARAAHDRLAPFFEKLKTTPEDPAANLAVGSFFCFSKGDWPRGLPLLAKGSDATLKQLALLELSGSGKVDDVNRLADGWWDAGAKESAATRAEIRHHAASLYKTALEGATGLRRALLERRIADAAAGPPAAAGNVKSGGRLASLKFWDDMGCTVAQLKSGALTHNNSTARVVDFPHRLDGAAFTQEVAGREGNITFVFSTAGKVYLFLEVRNGLAERARVLDQLARKEPGLQIKTDAKGVFEGWSLTGERGERVDITATAAVVADSLERVAAADALTSHDERAIVHTAANRDWQQAIHVKSGNIVTIIAAGTWCHNVNDRKKCTVDANGVSVTGVPPGKDGHFINDAPMGSLIGQIGTQKFVVGKAARLKAFNDGILELRMNDPGTYDNDGELRVEIKLEGP